MTKCKYWDCGWCYAPENEKTNAAQGGCFEPEYCPYLKSQITPAPNFRPKSLSPEALEAWDAAEANIEASMQRVKKLTEDPHDLCNLQLPNGDFLKSYPEVTRVELITNWGREIVELGCSSVKVSLQDDGRTIKVFLSRIDD